MAFWDRHSRRDARGDGRHGVCPAIRANTQPDGNCGYNSRAATAGTRCRNDDWRYGAGLCLLYVFISEGRRYFSVHAEMELASEIHRVLVPKIETRIGDFEFCGRSLPSGQVGGDLIDLVQNREKWIAYIADVSGHGVAPGVPWSRAPPGCICRPVKRSTAFWNG